MCFHCQVHSPEPAGLPLKLGYMPSIVQLLDIILDNIWVWVIVVYSYKRADAFRNVSAQSKQQETFHVWQSSPSMWLQTKGNILEQFGLIFAKENFLSRSQATFFCYLFIPSECNPFFAHCVFFPFKAVYSESQWCCVDFDANGGCSVGGAHGLMSSKCSAQRFLLLLTGDEAFVVEKIGGVLAEGACTRWLISRCVLELAGPNHIVVETEEALM